MKAQIISYTELSTAMRIHWCRPTKIWVPEKNLLIFPREDGKETACQHSTFDIRHAKGFVVIGRIELPGLIIAAAERYLAAGEALNTHTGQIVSMIAKAQKRQEKKKAKENAPQSPDKITRPEEN